MGFSASTSAEPSRVRSPASRRAYWGAEFGGFYRRDHGGGTQAGMVRSAAILPGDISGLNSNPGKVADPTRP